MAKPQEIGAQRINPKSKDPIYKSKLIDIFYGDVAEEDIDAVIDSLHPDEPAQVTRVPSPITAERFGNIPRHFIRCTQDKAILIEVQDDLIEAVDLLISIALDKSTKRSVEGFTS